MLPTSKVVVGKQETIRTCLSSSPPLCIFSKVETFLCNVPFAVPLIKRGISYPPLTCFCPHWLVSGILEEWFSHRDGVSMCLAISCCSWEPCNICLQKSEQYLPLWEEVYCLGSDTKKLLKIFYIFVWMVITQMCAYGNKSLNESAKYLLLCILPYSIYTSVGIHTRMCVCMHTQTNGMVQFVL